MEPFAWFRRSAASVVHVMRRRGMMPVPHESRNRRVKPVRREAEFRGVKPHLHKATDRGVKPLLQAIACAMAVLGGASSGHATTVVPPEFPALVAESDYIVHAVVKSVRCEKREGPKGAKIVTLVELNVIDAIAGTPPATPVLQLLGGRVGGEELRVEGMPRFKVGDEDVLFVQGNGHTICPLPAMMHGRYPVQRDAATGRSYISRADGAPLVSTAETAAPLADHAAGLRRAANVRGLELSDFIQQIRSAAQAHALSNRTQ